MIPGSFAPVYRIATDGYRSATRMAAARICVVIPAFKAEASGRCDECVLPSLKARYTMARIIRAGGSGGRGRGVMGRREDERDIRRGRRKEAEKLPGRCRPRESVEILSSSHVRAGNGIARAKLHNPRSLCPAILTIASPRVESRDPRARARVQLRQMERNGSRIN